MKRQLVTTALVGVISLYAAGILAEDQLQTQDRLQTQQQTQERIYGSQLMTDQERNEYRNRIGSANTEEERNQIRNEHHQRMQQRAKERGLSLPDEPPAKGGHMGGGKGMGPGGGMGNGGGMSPSGGMGSGKGKGK